MGARHSRLAAALAASWEAEVESARLLDALSERMPDPRSRAKLRVLAAFCRAHASRLIARLSALGRGPLPVPRERELKQGSIAQLLLREAAFARASAAHYESTAQLARQQADLSSAWVCELNRTEEEDRAGELSALARACESIEAQEAAPEAAVPVES